MAAQAKLFTIQNSECPKNNNKESQERNEKSIVATTRMQLQPSKKTIQSIHFSGDRHNQTICGCAMKCVTSKKNQKLFQRKIWKILQH